MGNTLLTRTWRALIAAIATIDWALVVIVAAFLAATPMGIFFARPSSSTAPVANPIHAAYAASIAGAAVKQPDYSVELDVIGPTTAMVNVASLGPGAPPLTNRTFDMWVSLASRLRAACAGATDPLRRLQQILGLPPIAQPDRRVTELVVPRDGLYRPCVAGGDIAEAKCAIEFPDADPLATSTDVKQLQQGYERMRFVAKQMWTSYRDGFPAMGRSAGDYPSTGYPFTGMGWTYDWSDASNRVGVSEFIVRREATVSVVRTQTPAEFCSAATTPST